MNIKANTCQKKDLGALGGTLNRDPCSLWGVFSGLPGYIVGPYMGYISYWD